MKVLVNGGLNLSVLDGWWAEAWDPSVGWAIGVPAAGAPALSGDDRDAESLFRLVEHEIVPSFYDRDAEGLPRTWLGLVRASLSRLTPRFSANRMMREYVSRLYAPAAHDLAHRLAKQGAVARQIEAWHRRLVTAWPGVRMARLTRSGDGERVFTIEVFIGDLALEDVAVELYADPATSGAEPERVPMTCAGPLPGTAHGYSFTARAPAARPAWHYTPRVVPAPRDALLPIELPLVTWLC
jgi:starch phosphorylase